MSYLSNILLFIQINSHEKIRLHIVLVNRIRVRLGCTYPGDSQLSLQQLDMNQCFPFTNINKKIIKK